MQVSKIEVSVIITAHNRRDHILDAVKSVVDQSTNVPNMVEIIVVKDFEDESIDAFLFENKVEVIYKEGSLGGMLYEGISKSHGDLISFLDDDDMFFKDKLVRIISLFRKYPDAFLISNRYKSFNTSESRTQLDMDDTPVEIFSTSKLLAKDIIKLINDRIDFNLSSISIRRTLIENYMEKLRELKGGPDTFFFLIALDKRSDIIRVNRQLTSYRVRNISNSKESFIKNDLGVMQERAVFMCEMLKPFTRSKNRVCVNVARYLYEDWRVTQQLLNQSGSRKSFMKLLAYRPRSAKLTFSPYYVLKSLLLVVYLLSPRLGLSFYRVLKNNQSRSILN